MQRIAEDDTSFSTDLRSDISFMNKQKELRNLYRDFRTAIDSIQSSTQQPNENDYSANDEEDIKEPNDMENVVDNPSNSNTYVDHDEFTEDVQILLQEIDMLDTETDEITRLLDKSKLARNPRVKPIRKQLAYIKEVFLKLRDRAERLGALAE